MGLFDDLLSPLKDITEMVNEVKDDVLGSVTQITDDVTQLKDEGQSAISDLTGTIRGNNQDSDQT